MGTLYRITKRIIYLGEIGKTAHPCRENRSGNGRGLHIKRLPNACM
jgi:hypothetical protein